MTIKSSLTKLSAVIFIVIGICSVGGPKVSAATTRTWDVTCSSDCVWSNPDNWSGGVAPISGDSLVFPSVLGAGASTSNDIVGLSIKDITFSESDYDNISYDIDLATPLTITGGVYNYTNGSQYGLGITGDNIILGGDIVIESDSLFYLGGTGGGLNLNGHSLTFSKSSNPTPPADQVENLTIIPNITGNGSIIADNSAGDIVLYGSNTYTGTTVVKKGYLSVTDLISDVDNKFGSSVINISKDAGIRIISSKSATINNTINISGITTGTLLPPETLEEGGYVGSIYASIDASATLAIPHIILAGSTYFLNTNQATAGVVDISGINKNQYTLKFLIIPEGEGEPNLSDSLLNSGFIYTPAVAHNDDAPTVTTPPAAAVTTVIKAPNTAIRSYIRSNPIIIAFLGILSATTLVIFAKQRSAKK